MQKNMEKLSDKFQDLLSNPKNNNIKMYKEIKNLVNAGVPINTVNRFGDNLLMVAVKSNNETLFDYALQNSKHLLNSEFIDSQDYLRGTAVMFAAESGNLNLLKKLHEVNADANKQSFGGWSALILAAKNCDTDIIKELKEMGANPNLKTTDGNTAAMEACRKNKNKSEFDITETLKLLKEMGADFSVKNTLGETMRDIYLTIDISPILDAAAKGNNDAKKILMENSSNPTAESLNLEHSLKTLYFIEKEIASEVIAPEEKVIKAKPESSKANSNSQQL